MQVVRFEHLASTLGGRHANLHSSIANALYPLISFIGNISYNYSTPYLPISSSRLHDVQHKRSTTREGVVVQPVELLSSILAMEDGHAHRSEAFRLSPGSAS